MPITVTSPLGPGIGPGIQVALASNFIGPIGTDAQWTVQVFETGGEQPLISQNVVDNNKSARFTLGVAQTQLLNPPVVTVPDGTEVRMVVTFTSAEAGVFESETIEPLSWHSTSAIATLLQDSLSSGAAGGFTAEDRVHLVDTERRTQLLGEPTDLVLNTPSGPIQMTLGQLFSRDTLDQLTLSELTSGETCEPIRASVSLWYVGVIVRVTTIAPDLVPKTPDEQWYFPDLAVLRVFRGNDLQLRRGIHTPTFMIENPWEWGWQFLNAIPVLGTPPNITIAVDWRPGCCGRVYLQSLP